MSFHTLILSLLASRSIPLSHQFNKHSISILIVYFFHSFFANLASFRFYQLYSYLQLFCVLCNLKAPPVSPQRFTRKMLCKFSGIFRWPNLWFSLYFFYSAKKCCFWGVFLCWALRLYFIFVFILFWGALIFTKLGFVLHAWKMNGNWMIWFEFSLKFVRNFCFFNGENYTTTLRTHSQKKTG